MFICYFSGIRPRGLNLRTNSNISPMVNSRICEALASRCALRSLPSAMPEVTSSISAMDTITQQNTALAEESAATARRLAEAAVRLEKMIQAFKIDQTASPMSNAA